MWVVHLFEGYCYMGFSCRWPVFFDNGERHSRTSSQLVVEFDVQVTVHRDKFL